MKTRAHQDVGSGRWVINGSKCWISGAKEAGVFLVFANAAPELKLVSPIAPMLSHCKLHVTPFGPPVHQAQRHHGIHR